MSYTTVYAAFSDGDMVELGECHNAWRGAMWIWTELAKRYVPGSGDGGHLLFGNGYADVWKLADGAAITDGEWYALVSTFDGVLVPSELMLRVADALDAFEPGTDNLKSQAEYIRDAHSKGARAIGWLQTSVCCSPWWMPDGDDNDRPYNIDTDAGSGLPELSGKTAWWMTERKDAQ